LWTKNKKENYENYRRLDCYLTVGRLKKTLENVPDDTKVYYQRIEDFYFNENDWKMKYMRWENYEMSEYIRTFSAYKHPDTGDFVLNAHY
jgi:hypothetical protein